MRLIDADAYLDSIKPRGISDELWKECKEYKSVMSFPSAQPELVKESGDLVKDLVKDDTISRQVAINAIRASTSKYTGFMEMEMYTDDDAVEAIEGLPSIQLSRIERELHGKTPEEQYKILYQLMFEYANTFNDARRAVIDWLGE